MAKTVLKRMSGNMPGFMGDDEDFRAGWEEAAAKFDKEAKRVEDGVDRYFELRFQREFAFERAEAALGRMEALAVEYPPAAGFVMDAYDTLGKRVDVWAYDREGNLDFDVARLAVEGGSVFARKMLSDELGGRYHEPLFRDPSSETGTAHVFEGWHERVGRDFQDRVLDGDGNVDFGRSLVPGIDLETVDKAIGVVVGRHDNEDGADMARYYLDMVRHRGDAIAIDHLMDESVKSGLVDGDSRGFDMLAQTWRRVMLDAATATVPGRMTPDESLRKVAFECSGMEYDDASDSLRVDASVAPEWLLRSLADDPPAAMRGDGSTDMRVITVGDRSDDAPLRGISKPPVIDIGEVETFLPGATEGFSESMRALGDADYDGPFTRGAARYTLEDLAGHRAVLDEMALAAFDDGDGGTDYTVPAIAAAEGYVDEDMFDACVRDMVADPANAGTGSGSPLAYVWAGIMGNSDAAVRFSQLVGDARREMCMSGNVGLIGLCEDVAHSLDLGGEEDALEAWESRMLPGIERAEEEHGVSDVEVVTDSGIAHIRAGETLSSMNPQMREALDQFTRAYLAGVAAIRKGEPVMMTMQGGNALSPVPEVGEDDRDVARSVIDGIEL